MSGVLMQAGFLKRMMSPTVRMVVRHLPQMEERCGPVSYYNDLYMERGVQQQKAAVRNRISATLKLSWQKQS